MEKKGDKIWRVQCGETEKKNAVNGEKWAEELASYG